MTGMEQTATANDVEENALKQISWNALACFSFCTKKKDERSGQNKATT